MSTRRTTGRRTSAPGMVAHLARAILFIGPLAASAVLSRAAAAQRSIPAPKEEGVTIRLVNTELRAAVQLVAQYLDRPVVFSGPGGAMVTLETPRPMPRADVPRLLQSLLDSQNYELVNDTVGGVYRVRPKEAPKPPPPDQMQVNQSGAPRGAGNIELFVLPLKHARAADVASTVNALYGKGVARTDVSRRQTLGDELRQNQIPPLGTQTQPYQNQQPVVVTAASTNTTITGGGFTGEVTIVPDARANNLLVRANRTDYALIENVVQQLDTRPLQVMIEVLIAEVQHGQSLDLGTDTDVGETTVSKTLGTVATGNISGAGDTGLGAFAIKVMKIGGINLDATLHAVAGKNHVAIVSRPVVLTTNNQEAEIVVGTQRPFVQVSRSLPTDQAIRDQVVQYKDVGTKLSVRPSISVDGSVELEVKQEVSSATTETAFNAPVISTRSVQTQLLIKDGQTVMLGGLRDKQKDVTSRGLVGLSSLPIIGGLFGHTSRQYTETELFIFLTPHVIRSDEDAARISNPIELRSLQLAP